MKRKITMVALILFFMVTCLSLKGQKISASTEGVSKTEVADATTWYGQSLNWYNNPGTNKMGDASFSTTYITPDRNVMFTVEVDGAAAIITKINVLDGSALVVIPKRIILYYLKEDVNGALSNFVTYNGTDSWTWANAEKKYIATTCGTLTVTGIGASFSGNVEIPQTWIKEAVLPSTITKIDSGAFAANENMETVVMTGVKEVGSAAFSGCTSLTKVLFGQSLQNMDASAFKGCNGLINIDLTGDDDLVIGTDSSTNTIADIPVECFSGCTNLENIRVSNRVVNIRSKAFYQSKLSEFKFENTQIKVIESSAFAQCNGLDYVALPDVINAIGKDAFIACENLRYVYIPKTLALTDTIVESGKLINGKDLVAPSVYKGTAEVKDLSYVFSSGTYYVGDTVDVKKDTKDAQDNLTYDAVVVKRNGIAINDVGTTFSVSGNYNINTYSFTIPQGAYGTYTVTATDILGNSATRTFYYPSDEVDVTAPAISGVVNNGSYKSTMITFSDNISIKSAKLNGQDFVSGTTVAVDGSYTLVVTDSSDNAVTNVFTIDNVKPTITGVKDSTNYSKAVTLVFLDNTGIKSALLNGNPISNNAVVMESGKYIVTVTDLAGNEVSMNFLIDIASPIVTGIENNKIYNTNVTIYYSDYTGVVEAKLGTENILSGHTISAEGKYTFYAKDNLGNRTTIMFTIDKTLPMVTTVKEGTSYKTDLRISISDNIKVASVYLNDIEQTGTAVAVTAEGSYKLVVIDSAGNVKTINFKIDKTAPSISNISNGKLYKSKSLTINYTDASTISSAKLNGIIITNGKKITKAGNYTLVVIDSVGNTTTITFTIDRTAPTVTGISKKKTVKKGKSIKISDKNGIKSAKLNGKKYVGGAAIKKTGKYKLVVIDKAGNSKTISFKVVK